MSTGDLYIVSTPIGNLSDITLRALDVLRRVDLVAAEDTRRTRKLLTHYDIHKPLISYHSNNARQRGPELIGRLQRGESIALVTDAGTPGVSDPGTALIHDAIAGEISVVSVPGPSAVTTALAVSGLPTHPFAFLGFPPPRGGNRKRFFLESATLPFTLVVFESPKRVLQTLQDVLEAWGNRPIAVARELTKRFEEVFRGDVRQAIEHFESGARGEITLVIAGSSSDVEVPDCAVDWRLELRELLSDGMSVKDATRRIVECRGLAKRSVYREAVDISSEFDESDDGQQ